MLTSLSGFPEWLPEDQLIVEAFVEQIKEKFRLYGFTPLRTRAVEPLSTLLLKGETSKEIYVLRRLQAEEEAGGNLAGSNLAGGSLADRNQAKPSPADKHLADNDLGLHFDLTVPFARYVNEHKDQLVFPLRRYQVQEAWRGERPGLGRYREFLQADFDIIGEGELPIQADTEIVQMCVDLLAALPLPEVQLRINNRKILEGISQALGIQDSAEILRTIDKVDKIGEQGVFETLTQSLGIADGVVETCLRAARIKADSAAGLEAEFRDLGLSNETLRAGLDELGAILDTVRRENRVSLVADVSIARGLDYYTGTVFEARFPELTRYPSILGGGRYDHLAGGGSAKKMPGVGGSIGLSRILGAILNEGVLKANRPTSTVVLVGLISSELYANSVEIAQILRGRNIPCEIFMTPDKYGKQIRYATRKGMPYIWFPGEAGGSMGEVKDLRSGVQIAADANQWLPSENLGVEIRLDEKAWQEMIQKPIYGGSKQA